MSFNFKLRLFGLIIVSLIIGVLSFKPSTVHAAASISFSPGSGTYSQGQSFTVVINVNTGGDTVNAVEVILNYPSDILTANYISDSGSAFDVKAESTIGAGSVKIARGKIPPGVSGFRRVATVGFTANGQGTAALTMGPSQVLRESNSANILSGQSSATFKIGESSQASEPPSPTEGSASRAQESGTQAPTITGIEVLNLGIQTATISWKTDEDADSSVEYGFLANRASADVQYFFNATDANLKTEHQIKLDPETLSPGNLYHFRVVSKDESGNQTTSEDQTFVAPGYPLTVTVFDARQKIVPNARVFILPLGVEAVTDENGKVTFSDLPVGDIQIKVEYKDVAKEESAALFADENQVTIVLDQKISKFNPLGIIVVIILILVIFGLYFIRRKEWPRLKIPNNPQNPKPPVNQSSS